MNPAVLFLAGGAGLAVVLSAVVWLFSRPKKVVEDPNQARANLRALRHGPGGGGPARGPGAVGIGGIRVLGDVSSEEPGSGSDTGSEGR
ncbi:MAG: hypothetical protein HOJ86_03305 [Acidimicrobiaceae bacterium]|nr:hypothetical protein [Acidimicrobiaceae bacterium]